MNLLSYVRAQWDRALAVAAVALGALSLLLGYLGTRDAVLIEQQVPYLASGGMFGILLLAVGSVLWLSADLRDDWRELRELKEAIQALSREASPASAPPHAADEAATDVVRGASNGRPPGPTRRGPLQADAADPAATPSRRATRAR